MASNIKNQLYECIEKVNWSNIGRQLEKDLESAVDLKFFEKNEKINYRSLSLRLCLS